jgi:hypothetical protein
MAVTSLRDGAPAGKGMGLSALFGGRSTSADYGGRVVVRLMALLATATPKLLRGSSSPSRCGGNSAEEHMPARTSVSSNLAVVEEAGDGRVPVTRCNPCGLGG